MKPKYNLNHLCIECQIELDFDFTIQRICLIVLVLENNSIYETH